MPEKSSRTSFEPLTRRSFLMRSCGLSIAVSFGITINSPQAAAAHAAFSPNAWVSISPAGKITIYSAACEMGQGVMTALPMVVAEEMDADWERVEIVQSSGNDEIYGNPLLFGNLITVGSLSVMAYYEPLRLVGAQTRKLLLHNVAMHWGVGLDELSTVPGEVVHKPSSHSVSYGEIAGFATVSVPLPTVSKDELKQRSEFRYIGKNLHRVDIPCKVDGTAKFGIDVVHDRLLYGSVERGTLIGGTVSAVDSTEALSVPGVEFVEPIDYGVGIIGDSIHTVNLARKKLVIRWSDDSPAQDYDHIQTMEDYAAIATNPDRSGAAMAVKGSAKKAISNAPLKLAAIYRSEYVAHACMEPMNATAVVHGNLLSVWVPTQSPTNVKRGCAEKAGFDINNITVHSTLVGGGLGRRSEDVDYAIDAALLAMKVPGRPVKVIWSREDDFRHDKFRPCSVQYMEAGIAENGSVLGLRHRLVCSSVFGRAHSHLLDRLEGKDPISAQGGDIHYDVAAHWVEFIRADRGIETGAWRGVGAGYMKFAIECFIDEIAAKIGEDPFVYRTRLLGQTPRALAVLSKVAEMAGWDDTRSADRAVGIAYSNAVSSYTALVAEVSASEATGVIKVHRVWCAIDPGLALQPRNIVAQLDGGIVMGLGAALFEQVNIHSGQVRESNFGDYRVMRMADTPEIHVEVLSTNNPPGGVGEAGVPAVAPAIANAMARLYGGKRLRHLPMTPGRVKSIITESEVATDQRAAKKPLP